MYLFISYYFFCLASNFFFNIIFRSYVSLLIITAVCVSACLSCESLLNVMLLNHSGCKYFFRKAKKVLNHPSNGKFPRIDEHCDFHAHAHISTNETSPSHWLGDEVFSFAFRLLFYISIKSFSFFAVHTVLRSIKLRN